MHQLQRLLHAHRRDRRRVVVAPVAMLVAARNPGGEQRHLQRLVALGERQPQLPREGRALLLAAIESARGCARRRCGQSDVGGRAQRGEEGLLIAA